MKAIKIKTDYIKLGQFLKFIGMISLGGEVKDFLANKTIKINNLIEKQRGKKLFSGDLIEIDHEKFIIEVENDCSKTENV